MPVRLSIRLRILFAVATWTVIAPAAAQDAAPLVRMLKSGRLPPDRLGNVLSMVCQRGAAEELAYIFDRAAEDGGLPADLRAPALLGLATAAETRGVRPEFDADRLNALVTSDDDALQRAAMRLAGSWRVAATAPALSQLALAETSTPLVRRAAVDALRQIGGDAADEIAEKLLAGSSDEQRVLGVAALSDIDLQRASQRAAALLSDGLSDPLIAELLAPFLARQGGSDAFAAAIDAAALEPDVAKLVLRQLYAAGRSDASLSAVLAGAAGLNLDTPMLDAEQLKALSAEAIDSGDARRGEAIFRRADLSCMKCHAVSGAGGDVGPDLSALGATSPPDYVITSILYPDLSIKENFITRAIATDEGKIYQGIVVDRDDHRLVLKEATGEKIAIPIASIDDEVEGPSLMPKGLASFLTQQEFLDLVKFLSLLGKPGEYEIRSRPTVQRWRVLDEPPEALAATVPDAEAVERRLLAAPDSAWRSAYAQVAGALPLDEIAASSPAADRPQVLYLSADLDVSADGPIALTLDDASGVHAWIDQQPLDLAGEALATAAAGPHKLLLRVDLAKRDTGTLTAIVDKAHGSTAAVTVVGGR